MKKKPKRFGSFLEVERITLGVNAILCTPAYALDKCKIRVKKRKSERPGEWKSCLGWRNGAQTHLFKNFIGSENEKVGQWVGGENTWKGTGKVLVGKLK